MGLVTCQYEGSFCYGVVPHGVLEPMKFGPFHLKKNEEEDDFACSAKLSLSTMSLVDPQDVFLLASGRDGSCKLQHLGGGYFFYVSTSQALIDDDVYRPDPHTRKVIINIFKEVEAEVLPECPVLEKKRPPHRTPPLSKIKSKIVFSQNYVSKTDHDCGGEFLSCFLVQSPVPTDQGVDNEQSLKYSKKE